MNSRKINVLLGAGFSKDAGIPMVNDINPFFDQDFLGKLCFFSDSQWRWWEFQNYALKSNGRRSQQVEVVEFIFNQLVLSMKSEVGTFSSYEAFLSFLISKDEKWFVSELLKAKEQERSFRISKGIKMPVQDYWKKYDNVDLSLILHVINYLIADLLRRDESKPLEDLASYERFLEYISVYDEVNFFTLNHDLLLEELLKKNGISFSDGFTRMKSEILGSDKQLLDVFQSEYHSPYRIFKLHGSKDHYAFEIAVKKGHMNYLTGERIYFRIDNYYDLHRSVRIDPRTGEIIQNFNNSVVPQFLTGAMKEAFLENDYMYSSLMARFNCNLVDGSDLLVVGYSYCDKHIDKVLQEVDPQRIVNVNPCQYYPYAQVKNLKYMTDL